MKAVAFTLEGVLCFNVSLALVSTKLHAVEMFELLLENQWKLTSHVRYRIGIL